MVDRHTTFASVRIYTCLGSGNPQALRKLYANYDIQCQTTCVIQRSGPLGHDNRQNRVVGQAPQLLVLFLVQRDVNVVIQLQLNTENTANIEKPSETQGQRH
jgi:hypothetical protein